MINLGDQVADGVSGFVGIAVARHTYLQGCERITLQPPIGKDKKLPEVQTFDELQLEVIKAGKVTRKIEHDTKRIGPGGLDKYLDTGRING